jgi:hypothetical protein
MAKPKRTKVDPAERAAAKAAEKAGRLQAKVAAAAGPIWSSCRLW